MGNPKDQLPRRKFQQIQSVEKKRPNLVSIQLEEGQEAPETIEIKVPGTSWVSRVWQWFYHRFAKVYSIRRQNRKDVKMGWQWYGFGSIGNAWYFNEKTKIKMTASNAKAMHKKLKDTYVGYDVEIHPALDPKP